MYKQPFLTTLSASEITFQSALDAILAELAALQLSGSGGVVNAPAWAGFTTWELLSLLRKATSFIWRLSLCCAGQRRQHAEHHADAALAATLLAYYTSSQVDALLVDHRTGTAQNAETSHFGWPTGHADVGGPHDQPNHLGAGVPLGRRPGHGDDLEHRSRAAQRLTVKLAEATELWLLERT